MYCTFRFVYALPQMWFRNRLQSQPLIQIQRCKALAYCVGGNRFVRWLVCGPPDPFVCSFVRSFVRPFVRPFDRSIDLYAVHTVVLSSFRPFSIGVVICSARFAVLGWLAGGVRSFVCLLWFAFVIGWMATMWVVSSLLLYSPRHHNQW